MILTGPRRWLVAGTLLLAAVAPAAAGWSPLGGPTQPTIELRFDPGRPELLYARVFVGEEEENFAEEAVLWGSEDGGATWRNLQKGLGRTSVALAIDPSNPKVIWVWTPEGELWRSGDAGDTWSRRFVTPPAEPSHLGVFQLLVDPHHPSTLFRAGFDSDSGSARLDVSSDGGASFHQGGPLPVSFTPPFVQAVRNGLVSFDAKGLEESTDGGQTWSVRGPYRANGFAVGSIAPSSPGTMYGIGGFSSFCLARSDDAGAHWRPLAYPPLAVNVAGCSLVAVDPKDARHVWVGGQLFSTQAIVFDLSESRDGGETWSGPLHIPKNEDVVSLLAAGGDHLYTGHYASTDGGRTWTRRDRGIATGDARFGLVAQDLSARDGGLRLVALHAPLDGGGAGKLSRSRGGRIWRGIPMPEGTDSIIDAGAPVVVAAGRAGVSRSQDGGDTWHVVPSGPPEASYFQSDLTRPRYLALHAFEQVDSDSVAFWTSDDAGATWRRSSEGLPIACEHIGTDVCHGFNGYGVDPFDPTRRWVAAQRDLFVDHPPLYVSTDAAASWHVLTEDVPPILALAPDPKVKDRLLAGTESGLQVSEDGGEHWHPLGNGLPDGAVIDRFARDPRSATWYAATTGHGIYRSSDGGANWTLLPGAPDLEYPAIAIDPRTPGSLLAAFRDQGIWLWTP
ncbi:MAG TPA: hypothetical protein VGQ28_13845 [Thermoanaerobaculia bacterium]|nr:hypothetical protein [Thermoanaerobaculia bacterium]